MFSVFATPALALLKILTVSTASAITLPGAPCVAGQFGCGNTSLVNLVLVALTAGSSSIAVVLLRVCAGLAVLFIVWAGFQMVISLGDEGKITQQKWAMAYAMIGLSVSILAQFIVSTVGSTPVQNGPISNLPFNIIANVTLALRTVLNAALVMMIAIAALRMLYAQGKQDDYNTGKKMLYWGLAGAVIVNLAAALVYAVAQFFGVL